MWLCFFGTEWFPKINYKFRQTKHGAFGVQLKDIELYLPLFVFSLVAFLNINQQYAEASENNVNSSLMIQDVQHETFETDILNNTKYLVPTHRIHVWYTYIWLNFMVNVGKCTSPMILLGI